MQSQPLTFQNRHAPDFTPDNDTSIALCTLNARYIHASLGLRYLLANMGALQKHTSLFEFTINQRIADIAEQLLASSPDIIGFGIYIWNIKETTELVALLKKVRPEIKIVIGGPEVSYEYENTRIFELCDYLITGQADFEFTALCQQVLSENKSIAKTTTAATPQVKDLALPYYLYTDEDISNRVLYVEASRGCPFKCEFCLSALDKTAWPFDLTKLLNELDALYRRGARQFKFVDRTFNLKISNCTTIMQFFLDRLSDTDNLFLHFEVIPDKLPDALKELIVQFPPGSLQFEIGIQSFNEPVQQTINRKQNITATVSNLIWLNKHSNAHIHADLIFGLPGETLETFAHGFDQLVALQPHEIQLGTLKRLRGSPIIRHTLEYRMCYSDEAPYQLLQNRDIDFHTMQRVQRFARYWDLIANSGRFQHSLPLLLSSRGQIATDGDSDESFNRFMKLSDHLFEQTGQTHKIAYNRLLALVLEAALATELADETSMHTALAADCRANGDAHPPRWLRTHMQSDTDTTPTTPNASSSKTGTPGSEVSGNSVTPSRQNRHLKGRNLADHNPGSQRPASGSVPD